MKIISIIYFFGVTVFFPLFSANNGVVKGRVYNENTNEPVPFANIVVLDTKKGVVTDIEGKFKFKGLEPGFTDFKVVALGFEDKVYSDVFVTNSSEVTIDIPMNELNIELEKVNIVANPYKKPIESPVSLRRIGISEIEKNPGGNRDISKVIQSLPGVASTPAFRNDLIVRGGGGAENVFYLDGVEIPNLNHFSTQGASGGPVGIINVDFLQEANFYSSAFPATRGGALSSVLDFKQINGNRDELKTRATLGASDLALTLDGPIGDNTTGIMSFRYSYLQFLFSLLELPFLPTYTDFQFKTRTRIDDKNEILFVGLGAIDQFELNKELNETPFQRYVLGYLPVNEQFNYTLGTVFKHYADNGYYNIVVSRNYLNNSNYKYAGNNEDSLKIFDFSSFESENKIRYERHMKLNSFKLIYGAGGEYARYFNETFRLEPGINVDYESNLDMFNYEAFGQLSRKFFSNRLNLSFGLRLDGSSYSNRMANLFKQTSPRLSVSYNLTPKISVNASTGSFFQRPPYTSMGYRDLNGNLLNKDMEYISVNHYVAGLELLPGKLSQITLEGFYKYYNNYPVSTTDGISIAGKSTDFGSYGDEEVVSIGESRAYGAELLLRSKKFWGFNSLVSYTLVWSEFRDFNKNHDGSFKKLNTYTPTNWDNRHLLNVVLQRDLGKNWEIGLKYRFVGGAPYTPYDEYRSSLVDYWDSRGVPAPDYEEYNSKRLNSFSQLDLRVDKAWFFDKWSLMFYVDIQNLLNQSAESQNIYTRKQIIEGEPVSGDPYADPVTGEERYRMKYLEDDGSGTIVPTLGIMIQF